MKIINTMLTFARELLDRASSAGSSKTKPLAGTGAKKSRRTTKSDKQSIRVRDLHITPDASAETEKQTTKQANADIECLPLDQRRWLTIKEMAVRYPFFSEKALRHLIFSAEAYAKFPKDGLKSNGFIDCIVRPAGQRKIIIDTTKFEEWLEKGSLSGSVGKGKGRQ